MAAARCTSAPARSQQGKDTKHRAQYRRVVSCDGHEISVGLGQPWSAVRPLHLVYPFQECPALCCVGYLVPNKFSSLVERRSRFRFRRVYRQGAGDGERGGQATHRRGIHVAAMSHGFDGTVLESLKFKDTALQRDAT